MRSVSAESMPRLAKYPVENTIADIAALDSKAQDFIYHWTELISESDKELAACFVVRSVSAFQGMESRQNILPLLPLIIVLCFRVQLVRNGVFL